MDLLRVFHYDKVVQSEGEILGSSEHTDWGSFTVVWQDDVGGLQTFCRACGMWRNVEAFDLLPGLLRFVIHIGDATSLALQEGSRQGDHPIVSQPLFPSPKHRVISPTTGPRVSLVYFIYPKPGESLASLATGLATWIQSHTQDQDGASLEEGSGEHIFPYDHYYLLHDQSANSSFTSVRRSPKEVYDAIFNRSMDAVFEEKWQQVQRSS